jgi:Protein of unknown function (DUF1580)
MSLHSTTETLRPFAEAAGRLPSLRGGKPVHPATVWRWASRGVRGRDGSLVRLEAIKIGGTCCTSDEALARFFRALSDDGRPPSGS